MIIIKVETGDTNVKLNFVNYENIFSVSTITDSFKQLGEQNFISAYFCSISSGPTYFDYRHTHFAYHVSSNIPPIEIVLYPIAEV